MATRSNIGIYDSDTGKVEAIYVHYDGYPSGVGKMLHKHYQDTDKVADLIDLGGVSFLEPEITKPEGHSFSNPVRGYTVFYGRDRGDKGMEAQVYDSVKDYFDISSGDWADYKYLYDIDTGKWTWQGGGEYNLELDKTDFSKYKRGGKLERYAKGGIPSDEFLGDYSDNFDVEVEEPYSRDTELQSFLDYRLEKQPITMTGVYGEINEDNTDVMITFSNGDKISYDYRLGDSASVNKIYLEKNNGRTALIDYVNTGMGTLIQDLGLSYQKYYNKQEYMKAGGFAKGGTVLGEIGAVDWDKWTEFVDNLKVGDVVANKETKKIGKVTHLGDKGFWDHIPGVWTDVDGYVSTSVLEPYDERVHKNYKKFAKGGDVSYARIIYNDIPVKHRIVGIPYVHDDDGEILWDDGPVKGEPVILDELVMTDRERAEYSDKKVFMKGMDRDEFWEKYQRVEYQRAGDRGVGFAKGGLVKEEEFRKIMSKMGESEFEEFYQGVLGDSWWDDNDSRKEAEDTIIDMYEGWYEADREGYDESIELLDEHYRDFNRNNVVKYSKGGKVAKKQNNDMIIGGVAGLLLGIFLKR